MERLTEKHYLGTDHYMRCSGNCNVDMDCIDCPSFDCLVERLAAYEDTGLYPESAEALIAVPDLITTTPKWIVMAELSVDHPKAGAMWRKCE